MAFEVTTVNRLAARRLLTRCGVKPEMSRLMGLRQLKEHLDNFVGLGQIPGDEVERELSRNAQEQGLPPNAGAAWTPHADEELREHYRRGMAVGTMASIRGRTVGAINARLQRLGLIRYNAETGQYEAVEPRGDNDATQAGEFANAEQLAAIEEATRQMNAEAQAEQASNAQAPQAGVDDFARSEIQRLTKRVGTLEQANAELQQTIADTVANAVKNVQGAYQRFEIAAGERVHRIEGLAHKAFPKLLRAVSARTRHDKGALNIWLYGPAGTGKSTAARKLAEAFNLKFHTNGPVGSQWDIRGFTDAQGKVVETAFRRAWIEGGVYCWDEGDGSAPAALIEANGALATGFASFPDGVFPRHPDCIVIINGNLRPGAAPDATYNGRYKQDTAFVNRFVAIEWGIDEDLERALLGKLDATGEQWVKFVRTLRKQIADRGIKGIVVSPRQLQYGIAMLDAGAPMQDVIDQTVRFMFTDEQWEQVIANSQPARRYGT